MKTKQERWDAYGERAFDLTCGAAGYLPYLVARAMLVSSRTDTALSSTFRQARVGHEQGNTKNRTVMVNKMRTRNQDHADIDELASVFRRTGVDELAQTVNLLEGSMSVCGPRILMESCDDPSATTHDEMMDNLSDYPELRIAWDSMKRIKKGGVLGTYSIHTKGRTIWTPQEQTPNRFVLQAKMELHDYENRSLANNLRLISEYGMLLMEKAGLDPASGSDLARKDYDLAA